MRMLLRDTVLRTLLCEDVAAYFLHLDRDTGLRTLYCVRMLLRDMLLRTLLV